MRAGENPIYNYGSSALPPVFALQKDAIQEPGVTYSLQTIPTMSSVLEFDPEKNQPNFYAMLEKRLAQARLVASMEKKYRGAYGYSQHDIDIMDSDVYAREIMDAVNDELYSMELNYRMQQELEDEEEFMMPDGSSRMFADMAVAREESILQNKEYDEATAKAEAQLVPNYRELIYAGGTISRELLVSPHGKAVRTGASLDAIFIEAVLKIKSQFMSDNKFRWDDEKQILSSSTGMRYISYDSSIEKLEKAGKDPNSRVLLEDAEGTALEGYRVEPEFYEYLAKLDSWESIANGAFDKTVRDIMNRRANTIDTDGSEEDVDTDF